MQVKYLDELLLKRSVKETLLPKIKLDNLTWISCCKVIHTTPIDPAAKPIKQKKANSTNSLNGEFRTIEICLFIDAS